MFKKIITGTVIIVFVLLIVCVAGAQSNFSQNLSKKSNLAATFFSLGLNLNDLFARYANTDTSAKIKILLVPGHEPNFGGAEYKNLKERDLNLILATKLKSELEKNPKFQVTLARDTNGWNPVIANYFQNNQNQIKAWVIKSKQEMHRLIRNGQLTMLEDKVNHSVAPFASTLWLYGINKWASDNKVDIALHVHFNDNPRYRGQPAYRGFTIYIPEKQYTNASSSRLLAQDLMTEMVKIQNVSTMPKEIAGLIEDQELIAVGSHNTVDSLSALIEYAYIYEDIMQSTSTRQTFIDRASQSTAIALNNFFNSRVTRSLVAR